YHYWEDGGATYHNRYSSWEISRGQEGDQWKAIAGIKEAPDNFNPPHLSKDSPHRTQDFINRRFLRREEDMPQAMTFRMGEEFIEANHQTDNWFLTIETFDPHEPFFVQPSWQKLYEYNYDALGITFDWPPYRKVKDGEEKYVDHLRHQYAALLSMCDHYLGRILDVFDRHDLWKDTMLIVNTDHGFMLGEHGWLAKNNPPLYREISNTPFFIWDPRCGKKNERRQSLAQTIDIAPTLLDFFGIDIPADMQGKSLGGTAANDFPVHDSILFGYHSQAINCTDGRYVFMRYPQNEGTICNYTLMPCNMRGFFAPEAMKAAELSKPFSFTKGMPVLRIPGRIIKESGNPVFAKNLLFDLAKEPEQAVQCNDQSIIKKMLEKTSGLVKASDAPEEIYSVFNC
ncbi:MAG TPA: sulfatase, partial [Spirochaetia bacterium]|nr:sulfatase [Spirochaetia bacterium]